MPRKRYACVKKRKNNKFVHRGMQLQAHNKNIRKLSRAIKGSLSNGSEILNIKKEDEFNTMADSLNSKVDPTDGVIKVKEESELSDLKSNDDSISEKAIKFEFSDLIVEPCGPAEEDVCDVEHVPINNNFCRLCLNEINIQPFNIWNGNNNYVEQIYNLCQISISKSDSLHFLCSHCTKKIKEYHDFRSDCIKKNIILEKITRNLIKTNTWLLDQEKGDIYNADKDRTALGEIECEFSAPVSCEDQSDSEDLNNYSNSKETIIFKCAKEYKNAIKKNKLDEQEQNIVLECEMCPAVCEGLIDINLHIESHSALSKYKFSCDEKNCEKMFIHRQALYKHLNSFHGLKMERKFTPLCHFCGKLTNYQHIRKHFTGGRYECKVCGCQDVGYSHKHRCPKKRILMECPQCGKKVLKMKQHIKLVHGTDPVVCKICGKFFYSNYNFKTHMRTHTGEKPFSCPDCQMSFTHRVTMKLHRLQVHDINMFDRPADEVKENLKKSNTYKRKKITK